MLNIYKNLFDELDKRECMYFLYKGYSHLQEDLNGERGDIDILVPQTDFLKVEDVIKSCGFYKVLRNKIYPNYYVARRNSKFLLLDLDTKIRFGASSNVFHEPIWDKLSVRKENVSKIIKLEESEYYALTVLIRLSKDQILDHQIAEIDSLKNTISQKEKTYFRNIVEKIIDKNDKSLLEEISKQEPLAKLLSQFNGPIKQFFSKGKRINELFYSCRNSLDYIRRGLSKVLFRAPSYRIRKRGFLVAFVGVDGSGKSSTIESIMTDSFYTNTGVKNIYFGSNQYWIPGLNFFHKRLNKYIGIRTIVMLLISLDRQLRIFFALYLKRSGNLVLCDRFYFDDEIVKHTEKSKASSKGKRFTLKQIKYFFLPRAVVQPDITFFMDVCPSVAYERKQDFDYNLMLEVNKAYKDFMPKVNNVVVINANDPHELVLKNVYEKLAELEKVKYAK